MERSRAPLYYRQRPLLRQCGLGPNIYESIGVTPIVNCRGTFTIITGSQTLPEVKKAMDEASRHYIHIDELMNGVGARLAELTKADWGIVTAGCAAALTNATSPVSPATNPERMQRIPKLDGMKNEVIIPKHSRNVYDHAVRMPGVDIIEVGIARNWRRPSTTHGDDHDYVVPARRERPSFDGKRLPHREDAQRSDHRGCGRGDAHDSEHISEPWSDHGRL